MICIIGKTEDVVSVVHDHENLRNVQNFSLDRTLYH